MLGYCGFIKAVIRLENDLTDAVKFLNSAVNQRRLYPSCNTCMCKIVCGFCRSVTLSTVGQDVFGVLAVALARGCDYMPQDTYLFSHLAHKRITVGVAHKSVAKSPVVFLWR